MKIELMYILCLQYGIDFSEMTETISALAGRRLASIIEPIGPNAKKWTNLPCLRP
jgi:hypothetical protein